MLIIHQMSILFHLKIVDFLMLDIHYKDFLLVEDFVKILYQSMLKNISGIFNLSSNEKIYIKDIAKWISRKTRARILYSNEKTYSFTLNNNKLLNKLKIDKKLLNLKKNIIRII